MSNQNRVSTNDSPSLTSGEMKPQPAISSASAEIAHPMEEITQELILMTATFKHIPNWSEAAALSPTTVNIMRQYLTARAKDLKRGLTEYPTKIEPASDLQVLDFVLQSLPV